LKVTLKPPAIFLRWSWVEILIKDVFADPRSEATPLRSPLSNLRRQQVSLIADDIGSSLAGRHAQFFTTTYESRPSSALTTQIRT